MKTTKTSKRLAEMRTGAPATVFSVDANNNVTIGAVEGQSQFTSAAELGVVLGDKLRSRLPQVYNGIPGVGKPVTRFTSNAAGLLRTFAELNRWANQFRVIGENKPGTVVDAEFAEVGENKPAEVGPTAEEIDGLNATVAEIEADRLANELPVDAGKEGPHTEGALRVDDGAPARSEFATAAEFVAAVNAWGKSLGKKAKPAKAAKVKKVKAAKGTKAPGRQLFGHAVTTVIRFMGSKGLKFGEARRALAAYNLGDVADATVQTCIFTGRHGKLAIAPLDAAQAAELLAAAKAPAAEVPVAN